MIDIAPYLSGTPLRRLQQAQAFLDHLAVPSSSYLVTADRHIVAGETISIIYADVIYGGRAPACNVTLASRSNWIRFRTHLYDAIRSLVLLYRDPSLRSELQDLNATIEQDEICSVLKLDCASILKPAVSASSIGNYVAPSGDGFTSFSVDSHGEITQEADSESLNSLYVQYALMKNYAERNMGAEFAQFAAH